MDARPICLIAAFAALLGATPAAAQTDNDCLTLYMDALQHHAAEVPDISTYPNTVIINDSIWETANYDAKACLAQGASLFIAIMRGSTCGVARNEKCGKDAIDALSSQTHHILGRWKYGKLTVE